MHTNDQINEIKSSLKTTENLYIFAFAIVLKFITTMFQNLYVNIPIILIKRCP